MYRPGAAVMLKLSLGLRLTNSRREHTRAELRRGTEVHRLLDAGLADATMAAYPGFRIVRDPAWLAVHTPDDADGHAPTHLDLSVREVAEGLVEAVCLAGLVAPRPGIGPSRLAHEVRALAARTGVAARDVAVEWTRRHVDGVLAPMVHLYATTGIGLEAHQQNTLVRFDRDGWPATGWFRDNQGFYLAAWGLPGVLDHLGGAAETSLAVAPEEMVDDPLTYYLLFNNVLGVVGALGAEGLAEEDRLLQAVGDRLAALVARGGDTPTGLVARWLEADTLPCKANFLTRMAGIDEVLAPRRRPVGLPRRAQPPPGDG
ncbi:MAG: IucA/IucC family C-terminal-domain containing protein [Acidimicrobiales bacterium]